MNAAALLDHAVAAYSFTDGDRTQLTDLLARGYLTAKIAAYQKASAATAHVLHLAHPWQPGADDVAAAQQWASAQVESIAATYADNVRRIATDALKADPTLAQDELERGLVGGLINVAAFGAGVAGGVKAFISWKSPQISTVVVGTGTQDGTTDWVEDVVDESESGDLVDLVDLVNDLGSVLDKLRVRVMPFNASNDVCATWAGRDFPIEDYDSIPVWPVHNNCQHSNEIYVED